MVCFKVRTKYLQHGFSVIELLVTIGIITLVTGVVLFKYSDFNSAVLLRSQAYELALDIREAQVYGVSVRGHSRGFDEEFGIYVDTAAAGRYIFFQDGSESPLLAEYNSGEEISTLLLDPRYHITSVCINACSTTDEVDTLSITFKRPNYDARMYATRGANTFSTISSATITIEPIVGTGARTVSVYRTGQVVID